jgi:hypothetical protein
MPVVGGFKHALVSDGTGLNVDNSTTRMSAMGQKQTYAAPNGMSALPPKADTHADQSSKRRMRVS